MDTAGCHFLKIPPEVRFEIYKYLLPDGGQKWLAIRNHVTKPSFIESKKRAKYNVVTPIQRRCVETTYHAVLDVPMHAEIMAVNRQIYRETSYHLYASHSFDFDLDLEAVGPFLSDLSPETRLLIPQIKVRKRGPNPCLVNDNSAWKKMCRTLSTMQGLQNLAVVVEGRRPREAYEGPQELSLSDFRLLFGLKTESLDWIPALAGAATAIRKLEIIPDVRESFQPTCSESILFAAFSASIHRDFLHFLKDDFGLPIMIC